MLDDHTWVLLRRLTRWLDQFKDCFGHRAQRVSLRQYVDGLLGDSPRKSMSAMLARVTEPGSYQALQHFITDAPWDAESVWRRLRAVLPERRGILILDETSFPKQGPHSVGVARQYCGALGKVANCQVAVTAALWTGRRAWPLGALLYLQALVRLAHQRWAIEQHYQHLKTELGLDHFEGRTYPGWQHHMVISAVAYAFLQKERMRGPVDAALTFPALRAIVQEIFTGLLFASRPRYLTWLQTAQAKYQLRI